MHDTVHAVHTDYRGPLRALMLLRWAAMVYGIYSLIALAIAFWLIPDPSALSPLGRLVMIVVGFVFYALIPKLLCAAALVYARKSVRDWSVRPFILAVSVVLLGLNVGYDLLALIYSVMWDLPSRAQNLAALAKVMPVADVIGPVLESVGLVWLVVVTWCLLIRLWNHKALRSGRWAAAVMLIGPSLVLTTRDLVGPELMRPLAAVLGYFLPPVVANRPGSLRLRLLRIAAGILAWLR